MCPLPIENIANIASFLPLREQMETFPEFNDCLKKVENKKKVIRRVLRNWYVDFSNENLNPGTFNFKRYTPWRSGSSSWKSIYTLTKSAELSPLVTWLTDSDCLERAYSCAK